MTTITWKREEEKERVEERGVCVLTTSLAGCALEARGAAPLPPCNRHDGAHLICCVVDYDYNCLGGLVASMYYRRSRGPGLESRIGLSLVFEFFC